MLDGQPGDARRNTGVDCRIIATSGVKKRAPGVQVLILLTVLLSACNPTAPDDVDITGTWIGTIEVQTCTDVSARACEANDFGRRGHRYSSELQINSDGRVQVQIDPSLSQRMSGEVTVTRPDSQLSFRTDLKTRFDVLVATIDWQGRVRGTSMSGTATITYIDTDRSSVARTVGRLSANRR